MIKPDKQASDLFQREVLLTNDEGLHARPAAVFVEKATGFKSTITIHAKEKEVDGKSIMDLLTLGAAKGTKLLIKAEGEDGQYALDALSNLVKSDFQAGFMQKKRGTAVNAGIAVGEAFVLPSEGYFISRRFVRPDEIPNEIAKLDKAINESQDEIKELTATVTNKLGQEIGDIFGTHYAFLDDKNLRKSFVEKIEKNSFCAEYAVSSALGVYAKRFNEIKDPYLSERVNDIYDIEKRLLKNLLGEKRKDLQHLSKEVILVAHDLSPSQAASLDKKWIKGFVTDVGGKASHTAIVAKALGIPAIVGLGDISTGLFGGDKIIIDGNDGVVFIRPDKKTENAYCEKGKKIELIERELTEQLKGLPSETIDGREIALMGNIKSPSEIRDALAHGAAGIGLYRTEFLYMEKGGNPSEDEQFEAYSKAAEYSMGRPLIIRTYDIGGDKNVSDDIGCNGDNPFLGLRSIRYCLQHRDVFRCQLRALLRASAMGDVKILLPMISSLNELLDSKAIIREVMDELRANGVPYNTDIDIGLMIEVPSAAILADVFAKEVDFFSIGTNDLVQYTLAVDRNNENVAHLYTPTHPAIIRLIKEVVESADRNNISVGLCGEIGGELPFTILLVGLGLKLFSVSPSNILPEAKKIVRSITYKEAKEAADTVLRMDDTSEIDRFLRETTRGILPGIVLGGVSK